MIDLERLERAYRQVRGELLAERTEAGHWVGRLSSSPLATATATSALAAALKESAEGQPAGERFRQLISGGLAYLARTQNGDGGWGDTDKSLSNIATTMLARAAFHLAGRASAERPLLDRAGDYIKAHGGLAGLRRRYGRDRTFAVPILANGALAGLVDWGDVAPLPFELACFPQAVFRFLRVPVVSYAIPALVAVGQARYLHRRPRNPLVRWIRRQAVRPSLRVLERMQPPGGGFLEAAPLTSFVVMSLAGSGRADHPVARRGLEFLVKSVRPDGSWPIDTNLATWVTTLSLQALASGRGEAAGLECLDWLLQCQHRQLHPFTGAEPGGWGWTDLGGAVPDADDTPGALLVLAGMRAVAPPEQARRIAAAAAAGVRWLANLQNGDGGWPTFCRGWGRLPFDRSGVDLTAHVLRALRAWRGVNPAGIDRAVRRGFGYIAGQQRGDGSWLPLWFGNQFDAAEENRVYGTSRALLAYRDWHRMETTPAGRGLRWLCQAQRPDGGWGTGSRPEVSGVEETAVAVEALLAAGAERSLQPAVGEGLGWLVRAVEEGRHGESTPIGLYFARLWYYERMYPLVFTLSALGRAVATLGAAAGR